MSARPIPVAPSLLLPLLLATLLVPLLAHAGPAAGDRPYMDANDRQAWSMESMRASHPDVRWRLEALQVLEDGNDALARTYLERAARYGDKPAQALLAELHWSGRGGPQDRSTGYAWMDLAAERGNSLFAAWREQYWAALDAAQRERALQVGQQVYAGFADAVAQPRLEQTMQQHRRRGTGSRTGAAIGVRVYERPRSTKYGVSIVNPQVSKVAVGQYVPRYYQDKFWKPDQYWEWKDAVLDQSISAIKGGTVTIGELQAERESERDD